MKLFHLLGWPECINNLQFGEHVQAHRSSRSFSGERKISGNIFPSAPTQRELGPRRYGEFPTTRNFYHGSELWKCIRQRMADQQEKSWFWDGIPKQAWQTSCPKLLWDRSKWNTNEFHVRRAGTFFSMHLGLWSTLSALRHLRCRKESLCLYSWILRTHMFPSDL